MHLHNRRRAGSGTALWRTKSSLLLTGATGFLGGAIRRAALAEPEGPTLVSAARSALIPMRTAQRTETILPPFDLRERQKFAEALTGVKFVIHAASYLGSDPQLSREINLEPVRTLVELGRERGVERIVYLSTTAVHGPGPHRGAGVTELCYAPRSPRSTDRMHAERLVLEAGGIVVRPHLVLGQGDRWVLPSLIWMIRTFGGLPRGGQARVSVIEADRLARLVLALAQGGDGVSQIEPGSAFLAAELETVTLRQILAAYRQADLRCGGQVVRDCADALADPADIGLSPPDHAQAVALWPLVVEDSWFNVAPLHAAVRLSEPPPMLPEALFTADSTAWYQKFFSKDGSP